jgi:hypothetical protein
MDSTKTPKMRAADMLKEMSEAYALLERFWTVASLEERKALLEEAKECSETNCSWQTYGAAQHVIRRANFIA